MSRQTAHQAGRMYVDRLELAGLTGVHPDGVDVVVQAGLAIPTDGLPSPLFEIPNLQELRLFGRLVRSGYSAEDAVQLVGRERKKQAHLASGHMPPTDEGVRCYD